MVPCYSVESDLALDLSISALLGDNIYNFGELLAHPILLDNWMGKVHDAWLSIEAETPDLVAS
ncbi:hypothetical protein E1A91_A11G332300v1 [Gossypium mustelinum]|uniref:PSD13 N-terminal domain-containing protein n=1 Tax=Gossypium mustelinum TaxID=34275 RepID=A0A5D2XE42_GOSMU|nr:hypothetical protein E1A91_A11G332300v1 [Gossypium mustelinum]